MPITFNSILLGHGIDPSAVALVRHQDNRADRDRTPYKLWRDHHEDFMEYQRRQSTTRRNIFGRTYWAVFVVTPGGDTVFDQLYHQQGYAPGVLGITKVQSPGKVEEEPYDTYEIAVDNRLSEFSGTLLIEWGEGYIQYTQYAERNDKRVRELRPSFKEEEFPGFLRFIKPLSEIASLPKGWVPRLQEAKGVYLLTCPRTHEQYVGSAAGEGGFYERWRQHLAVNGGAVGLQSRQASNYQVSVLEVAGSRDSLQDIVEIEQLWIRKLQSAEMGLNRGRAGNVPLKATDCCWLGCVDSSSAIPTP